MELGSRALPRSSGSLELGRSMTSSNEHTGEQPTAAGRLSVTYLTCVDAHRAMDPPCELDP